MKSYMNQSYAITNETIITYNGQDPVVKIPSRIANIEVFRIGDGSFMESSKMQCVILPPNTREIGKSAFWGSSILTSAFIPGSIYSVDENAFGNCPNLSDITIYDLELSANEYCMFKNASNETGNGIYVLHEIPKIELIQLILASITDAKPAVRIPNDISLLFQSAGDAKPAVRTPIDISLLFQSAELVELKAPFSLDINIPVIGFNRPSEPTTENKAFVSYIKSGINEIYDVKAEQKNDWYVRVGSIPKIEKTIIFTFDDTKTKEDQGRYMVNATLKLGYFFWQSAQPVIYENKKYYIYRRYYLGSDPELEYVRRDIAAYSEKGLVKNRLEAQNVYAKYKLLSIL